MIPSVSASRTDGLTSFGRLGRYLTHERESGTEKILSRGPVLLSDNLLSAETAAIEMKLAASQNKRVKDPVLHFQLSWKPGEQPTEQEWQSSATKAIAALGFADHQYIVVAHNDKAHFHVHIMLNRVHPETQAAHNPRMSLLTLHRTARELEHEYGREEAPGLYRWDPVENRAVRLSRRELAEKIKQEERPAPAQNVRPGRMDIFNDNESLRSFAGDRPARELKKLLASPASWQEVHALLGRHGLTMQAGEKGGYTVGVENSTVKVKASDVFRFAFSGKDARARTEQHLGPYEVKDLGIAFTPPRADYSRVFTTEERQRHANSIRQPNAAKNRQGPQAKNLDDLRSLSRIGLVPGNRFDQMLLQTVHAPHLRDGGSKEYLRVRRGSVREPETGGGGRKLEGSLTPQQQRIQEWKRKMLAESKAAHSEVSRPARSEEANARRAQRLKERQEERFALKTEFKAVAANSRALLREQTALARQQRQTLKATLSRDKQTIRSSAGSWQVRRALASQRIVEHLIAREELNRKLAEARAGVRSTTYREWVEQRAETGDKRAVAQLRGWRYKDNRTIKKIDADIADATQQAGRLSPAPTSEQEGGKQEQDWQTLANDRLQQLRDSGQQIDGLRRIKWKANLATGDVTYLLAGAAALVDRGKTIAVLKHDLDATKIALEIAVHKYGRNLDAQGSDVFQQQLIKAAVQQDLNVTFTDAELHRRFTAAKQQHKLQMQHDQRKQYNQRKPERSR